jgi:hypothetical protein
MFEQDTGGESTYEGGTMNQDREVLHRIFRLLEELHRDVRRIQRMEISIMGLGQEILDAVTAETSAR